jgi:hypothetical protein
MGTECDNQEQLKNHIAAWFGWMVIFGTAGIVVTVCIQGYVLRQCQQDVDRQSHTWMMEQADQLRRGEIDCLVNPDPEFVEELLADSACAARVREVYLGSDLGNSRLGKLADLPNLRCVDFVHAYNHSALLQSLHGKSTIDKLTFDGTPLSRDDLRHIASLPNLKLLAFSIYWRSSDDPGDRNGSIAGGTLSAVIPSLDTDVIATLSKLPHLRKASIGIRAYDAWPGQEAFKKSLKQAMPRCEFRFWDDER